ncbi:MAG: N-acetylmuramoyl-L-alanine amidase family protein [Verrucomicrobiales bacterium]
MKTLVALFLLLSLSPLWAGSLKTIIIDAGHGGRDIGGHKGKVYEKWLALDTALRLERKLKQKGFRTVMTRRSDQFISLAGRTAIANRYSNAAFVSIHYNYTWKSHVCGFETFYHSSRSRPLAQYVQAGMLNRLEAVNRGVKYARYYVIRHSKIPAILVEGGFVSNRKECERIKEGWFRESIAEGIADGIVRYKRSL